MGNTSPSGRAWPWWTGTSCWSWWSVEKSHDHPHPDHQHARAVLCDRRHQEEIGRLRGEAEATARKMQEELLAQAKEEGRRIVADAEAKRERMRVSLVSEMEEKAVDLASDILGRVFTAPVAQSIHAHLIDELIEEIGKSDGPRPELETETVEVAVPFPLTQTQRERLNTIFSSNMARSVDVKEIIVGEIVAGMVVQLGHEVLDGSHQTHVKGMLAYVRESLSR